MIEIYNDRMQGIILIFQLIHTLDSIRHRHIFFSSQRVQARLWYELSMDLF